MIKFTPDLSLKRDFADDKHWVDLARKLYIRLPVYGNPPTEEKMRYWMRKFRVPEGTYLTATGYKDLTDFQKLNPKWPLRAWVGLLIEYVVERDEAKGILKAYDRL